MSDNLNFNFRRGNMTPKESMEEAKKLKQLQNSLIEERNRLQELQNMPVKERAKCWQEIKERTAKVCGLIGEDSKKINAYGLLEYRIPYMLDAIDAFIFKQILLQNDADVIIVSIGSHDSKEEQFPTYSKQFSDNKKKVLILNIDPHFGTEFPKGPLGRKFAKNIDIFHFGIFFDKKLSAAVGMALNNGKHLIVQCFLAGNNILDEVHILAAEFNDKVGQQLEIIGGYDDIYFPPLVYSKHFFQTNKDRSGIHKIQGEIGGGLHIPFQSYQKVLETLNFGKLYPRLDKLYADDFSLEDPHFRTKLSDNDRKLRFEFDVIEVMLNQGKIKQAIEYLTTYKSLVGIKNPYGRTLAHLAVTANIKDAPDIADFISFLVKNGIDITRPDLHGLSPLAFTAWNAGPNTTKALIQFNAHKGLQENELIKIIKAASEKMQDDPIADKRAATAKLLEEIVKVKVDSQTSPAAIMISTAARAAAAAVITDVGSAGAGAGAKPVAGTGAASGTRAALAAITEQNPGANPGGGTNAGTATWSWINNSPITKPVRLI